MNNDEMGLHLSLHKKWNFLLFPFSHLLKKSLMENFIFCAVCISIIFLLFISTLFKKYFNIDHGHAKGWNLLNIVQEYPLIYDKSNKDHQEKMII